MMDCFAQEPRTPAPLVYVVAQPNVVASLRFASNYKQGLHAAIVRSTRIARLRLWAPVSHEVAAPLAIFVQLSRYPTFVRIQLSAMVWRLAILQPGYAKQGPIHVPGQVNYVANLWLAVWNALATRIATTLYPVTAQKLAMRRVHVRQEPTPIAVHLTLLVKSPNATMQ